MPKAKYRCLRTVVVDDQFKGTKDEVKFVEGRNYPLSDESYARWERRGVFGPIPEKKTPRGGKKAAANDAGAGDGQGAADAGGGDGADPGAAAGAATATTG